MHTLDLNNIIYSSVFTCKPTCEMFVIIRLYAQEESGALFLFKAQLKRSSESLNLSCSDAKRSASHGLCSWV